MKTNTRNTLAALTLCIGNIASAGNIPKAVKCIQPGFGLNSGLVIETSETDQAKIQLKDSYTINRLAQKIGIPESESSRAFQTVEFLVTNGDKCEGSSSKLELIHCHATKEIVFIKNDLNQTRVVVPVTDATLTSAYKTTENALAKFTEFQVDVGVLLPNNEYVNETLRMSYQICSSKENL